MALVSHLQNDLAQLNFCDETVLFQISTALTEALDNAVDHGNLEMDSVVREQGGRDYDKLREKRKGRPPYCDRKIYLTERLTRKEATYVILDEGSGFDPSRLPDPKDARNLLKVSGRGIMLIRTFMDEVSFNDAGNEITMVKRRAIES